MRSLNGQTFGKVKVVCDEGGKYVSAECVCGKLFQVWRYNLRAGKTLSCGKGACHANFKSIEGQKFGHLTAISLNGSRATGNGGALWNCKCACGTVCVVRASALRKGRTKSCGCMRGSFISDKISKEFGYSNISQIFANYKNGAKHRNLQFKLTRDEFSKLISNCCHYCGASSTLESKIENLSGDRIFYYNGIDRIDNTRGYYYSNCVTCCYTCNYAKRDSSYQEFLSWIRRLIKHASGEGALFITESVK